MKLLISSLLFGAAILSVSQPALATTGPGCLRVVNVQEGDVLNIRSHPSSKAAIVDRIPAQNHGIIALKGKCEPLNRPWANRWCPVSYYSGDKTSHGWVYARYIRDNDCP